ERALAAQEQVDGDEDPEGAAVRARAAEAGREDGRAHEGEEGDRVRAPDPIVRAASVPDGEGPPDRDGGGERGRGAGRGARRLHRCVPALAGGRGEERGGAGRELTRAIPERRGQKPRYAERPVGQRGLQPRRHPAFRLSLFPWPARGP